MKPKLLYVGMTYDYGDKARGYSFEHRNFYHPLQSYCAKQGWDLMHYDFMERGLQFGLGRMTQELYDIAKRERPIYLFAVLFDFDRDPHHQVFKQISSLGTVAIHWFCDDHWRFEKYSSVVAPNFDVICTTASSALPKYENLGIMDQVIKTQWACNGELYFPYDVAKDIQLSFVGQPHGNRREVLSIAIQNGLNVEVFGYGWENRPRLPFYQMVRLFSRSKINLNLSNSSTMVGQQIKGRNFEIPGTRSFLLTSDADNLEEYYENGKEIVIFHSAEELSDKARYYLKHDAERDKIAESGYRRTLAEHTWHHRFDEIFAAVKAHTDYAAQPRSQPSQAPQGRDPVVSVIIPCFNQAHFLPEAVESVVNQAYKNWECLIVNDGSPDNTSEVAGKLIAKHPHKRIRLVEKENGGLASARNAGIESATGKYILPLDADDLILPEMLQKTVALLDSHPEIAIAYTDIMHFGSVNRIIYAAEYNFKQLHLQNHLNYCSLYRREAWESVGGYNPNMIWGYEDWDFWIGCGEKEYHGKRIPEPLFMYRVKESSMYTRALEHDEDLRSQIILNHPGLYDEREMIAAKKILDTNAGSAVGPAHPSVAPKASLQERPLVSVIVATFNRPAMLVNALRSIYAQTYREFEVIVINDAGEDVESLITPMDVERRITYVRNNRNGGLAYARNVGIQLAHGKYIAYLDDDDIFYQNHLETLVAYLETSDYKVAYTDAYRAQQEQENGRYVVKKRDLLYSHDFNDDAILVSNFFPVLCVMHEKACLDGVGLFDEGLSTHEDWDLWIRLSRKYKFSHIKKVTAEFSWRVDGSSMTSQRRADFSRTREIIYDRYRHHGLGKPSVLSAQQKILETDKTGEGAIQADCSIIIPVWNRVELTRQCLTHLAQVTQGVHHEVIVVDNGSTDDTPAFLATLRGNVQIVRNEENLGFGKACNQGARAAKGRYLVFLNNDTIPLEGWLQALVDEVTAYPEVAVVGSKLLYPNGKIQHAGVVFSRANAIPYHVYWGLPENASVVNRRREFQVVTAACMLVRREMFEAVGGFDEGYRNGYEDVDLCLKVRDRGGRIVYQPKSVLYHLEEQTPGRKDHDAENIQRLAERWGGKWLEDEDAIYVPDGYYAAHAKHKNGRWSTLVRPLTYPEEKARWERVAEVQRLAQADNIAAVQSLLGQVDAWPDDTSVLRWGAQVCGRAGVPVYAGAFWRRLLALGEAAEARVALARLALEQGELEEADTHLRALLAQEPIHGEGWLLQGVLAMQRCDYAGGAAAFEAALRHGGDPRRARMGLGMAALWQGQAAVAWERFAAVLAEEPDDAEAIHWLLRAGTALERWQPLADQLLSFLRINPGDLAVRFALAGVYVRLGNWEAARQEYETLRLLQPTFEGLDQLAKALEHDVQPSEAAVEGGTGTATPSATVDLTEDTLAGRSFQHQAQRIQRRLEEIAGAMSSKAASPPPITSVDRPLHILFQNRPSAHSKPGGDTVVMECFKAELERLGVQVDIALGHSSLASYDLIHLFNFASPQLTEQYAREAVRCQVPFVVTTLYEDWPRFLRKSGAAFELFRQYLDGGRDERLFQANLQRLKALPPWPAADNSYTARHAACLLACSPSERDRLRQDYPDSPRAEVVMFGADHAQAADVGRDLFCAQYGVEDFVLCVGRLEARKNQLMLLKALERDEIPVVFMIGGVTRESDQPYAELCKQFQRRGRTLFLERVSEEMLASAYKAARVVCVPSWYELPGLVALEAARYGCPIVASRWGALEEYLGQGVRYCEPDDPESIRLAITQACAAPVPSGPQEKVLELRWARAAEELVAVYRDVSAATAGSRGVRQLGRNSSAASEVRNSHFDASIIIPVFNKAELTRQCLAHLTQGTEGAHYEVIVVDNASTDDTPAFLGTLGGDVQIIRNEENVGFARACNQGARAAHGRYLVFLNNDTIPLGGWLRPLVDEVEAHSDVAVVGSKLLYPNGTIQHAGMVFSRSSRLPYHLYWGFPADSPEVNRRREFQVVTGACMLVRREMFEAVGGFDEGYRNGYEDVDLCLKICERGGRIVYQPKSVLYHLEAQTPGRLDKEAENAKRMLTCWGHKWLEDEDMNYVADGYAIPSRNADGRPTLCSMPLADAGGRARWERVAEVQRMALAGNVTAVQSVLAQADAWPDDAAVLRWGAHVCGRAGVPAYSDAFWRRVLALEEAPEARAALARLALEQGALDVAETHLHALLAHEPTHGEGWLLKGVLALQRLQHGEAASAFEAALHNGGDARRARLGLGMAVFWQGQAEQAWDLFGTVLAEDTGDAEAIHWLLRTGAALERWEALADRLSAFLRLNPGALAVRFALAGVYVRMANWEAARQEYETLHLLQPTFEGLDELHQAIEQGEQASAQDSGDAASTAVISGGAP